MQVVLQLGLNTNDLKLITALIVAVFLAIPYWKSKLTSCEGGPRRPGREAAPMLDLKNVSKTFNPGTVNAKTALNDLTLHLDEGDFVTVIGGNGAGKVHAC